MDLAALAQQAINILVPALPFIYAGKDTVVDKVKDMLLDKGIEKLGSKSIDRAKALFDKIKSKKSESLEVSLREVSKNPDDPKVKEDLQQEILKLLRGDLNLAREIELTINLNIENVDQIAVGNYNNFFNFETPSGEELIKVIEYMDQRRKEAVNQEIISRYNPSALPNYPEKLKKFVTENRADELKKALTYIEDHRILLLNGVGGVGKSTLAKALVDLRPINVPKPFWFSFYNNQDTKLGDILEKLAAYTNTPEIASFRAEKREPGISDVDRLIGELYRRGEVWLIFDDLSMVLEDQQFADKGLELLFSSLRFNTHNAKVIATSRVLPILENGESLVDVDNDEERQYLSGLKTDFAVSYLSSNGLGKVGQQNLEKLAIGVDGHPLALKLLVGLVKDYGAADILNDLSIYQQKKEDTIKKARKLFDKLAGDEKEFLERISVYREPVKMKGLKEMFTENTPKNAVEKLIDKSLLETDHNGNYWLHPLVQDFSYDDLKNKNEAHVIAYNYYKYLSLPENPNRKEDLRPALEAHYHACKAEEYDLAVSVIWEFNLHNLLGLWEHPRILIEIYEKLLPNDHLKGEPIIKERDHGSVLVNMGNAYFYLGEHKKAIEYQEQALKIARKFGDRKIESLCLGNIGGGYFNLGEPEKAIEYSEQALEIAREVGDRKIEGLCLGNIGGGYFNLGEPEKAIEYFEQALEIAREVGDRRTEGFCLGNIGNTYIDLSEPEKAIEYFEQALGIFEGVGDRHGKCLCIGNMGIAYRCLGEIRTAIGYYEQGLKIAREIGNRRHEGSCLNNLGIAYIDLGEPEKAIDLLKESLAIGKSIEDPRMINFCEQELKELERFNE